MGTKNYHLLLVDGSLYLMLSEESSNLLSFKGYAYLLVHYNYFIIIGSATELIKYSSGTFY